jgi:hypothetical protein
MNRPPISHTIIAVIIAVAVILPIAICLILAVASLLAAMGDASGGGTLRWIALGCGIIWLLDLILLIISLGINSLGEPNDSNFDKQ